MEQYDLDFLSISMPVDDYRNLHTLPPSRALIHSLFYSGIDRSVEYSDLHYAFSDILWPDIPFLDSPISLFQAHEPYA